MHWRPAFRSARVQGFGGSKGKIGRIQSGGSGSPRSPMLAATWGASVSTGTSGLARDLICGGAAAAAGSGSRSGCARRC
jgi:hypothetical protein